MPTIIKCRAKNAVTCKYHGKDTNKSLREQKLASLMEAAAAEFDLETYHQYHLELDAIQGKIVLPATPTLDLDERLAALPAISTTQSVADDVDDDPHGDDANLAEHNRYTKVRDKINWRTFTDLTEQEQDDCYWLTLNDDDTQAQVAEYGTRDVKDLLARVGGSWVTNRSWLHLIEQGDEYIVTHVYNNPDTPVNMRNQAARTLESMTG